MPIIEIIGPPGSGKTTYARKIIDLLKELNIETIYYDDIPFIYNNPNLKKVYNLFSKNRITKKLIRKCFKKFQKKFIESNLSRVSLHRNYEQLEKYYLEKLPQSKYREERIKFFNKSLAYCIFCVENIEREFVIFDEGVLQRSFSLSLSGVEDKTIHNYFDMAPKPDITIIIDIENETIKKQLIKRDGDNSKFLEGLNNSKSVNRIGHKVLYQEDCTVFLVNHFNRDAQQEILNKILNKYTPL